jgi:iron(III) transport system substrate-binding protein
MIYSRRDSLKALATGLLFAEPAKAAAPPPTAITPELIAAARRESKVALYSGLDLPLSEKLAKGFEAKYPGIAVRVERSGAERIFQRIGQEQASRIYAADVVISTDAGHFVAWKRTGLLAPFVPQDVAQHSPWRMPMRGSHAQNRGSTSRRCAARPSGCAAGRRGSRRVRRP